MTDAAATWHQLPRRDRAELSSSALRGQRAINTRDALLMLWWARERMRRGAWHALWRATVVVVALQLLGLREGAAQPSALSVIIAVSSAATWLFERARLQQSIALNTALLAGARFDSPPDPDEAARILSRARREGWLRGMRHHG